MPSKTLELTFSGGIQSPPKLGTVILKPTASNQMSYAQNISVQTDVYGNSVLLPGYYFNPLRSNLANPVYWKATENQNNRMWVAYASTTGAGIGRTLDYIDGIQAGGTPAYNNSNTVTLLPPGDTAPQIKDIVSAQFQGADSYIYAMTNETGGGSVRVAAFQNASSINYLSLSTNTAAGVSAPLPTIKTQFDGKIYVGNEQKIDRIDPALTPFAQGTSVVLNAIGTSQAIPSPWFITALGEWNGLLVAAANNEKPGDFSKRNGGGQSRVFFWDIANAPTANYKTNFVNSPSHYISVLFTDLSGNLLAFGGVDEGRTTIYQYNGYGFLPLFSYIGDMPRNQHSVCFDAQGRLMWQTVNGEICRLNTQQLLATSDEEQAGAFEHLSTIQVGGQGTGGVLGNLQSAGFEFVASGGAYLSVSNISLFTGDGGAYSNTTPIAISGIQIFPQKSIITKITTSLNKALQQGEAIDINYYPQGVTILAGINLGSIDWATDGAIASKNIRTSLYKVDEAAFGIVWKTSNGTSTSPGVLKMQVDYNEISTT